MKTKPHKIDRQFCSTKKFGMKTTFLTLIFAFTLVLLNLSSLGQTSNDKTLTKKQLKKLLDTSIVEGYYMQENLIILNPSRKDNPYIFSIQKILVNDIEIKDLITSTGILVSLKELGLFDMQKITIKIIYYSDIPYKIINPEVIKGRE